VKGRKKTGRKGGEGKRRKGMGGGTRAQLSQ